MGEFLKGSGFYSQKKNQFPFTNQHQGQALSKHGHCFFMSPQAWMARVWQKDTQKALGRGDEVLEGVRDSLHIKFLPGCPHKVPYPEGT